MSPVLGSMTDLLLTEKRILGAMLVDPDRAGVALDTLREDDFLRSGHQEVFRAIRDLTEKGERVNLLSVAPLVQERSGVRVTDKLAELTVDVSGAPFIEGDCRTLAEARAIRDLASELEDLHGRVKTAQPGGEVLGEVLDELSSLTIEIRDPRKAKTVHSLAESLKASFAEMEAARKMQDRPGYRTGLHELDELIGGFRNGETSLIAASTSMGKSVLALQIAARAATHSWEHLDWRPARAMYVVTEMRREDLCKRLLAQQAEVDFLRIRDGRTDPEETARIGQALQDLRGAPLTIDACGRSKVARVARIARSERRAGRLDLLVIDLVTHLLPGGQHRSREQEVASVSRNITDIALELDIPIVMTCQVNRESAKRQNKAPNHETDLRESASLGHDASMVLMPWQSPDWDAHRVDIQLSKNRNGIRGGCTVREDFKHMRFQTNVVDAPLPWEERRKDLA